MLENAEDPSIKLIIAWIGIIGSTLTAIVALISAIIARRTSRQNQKDLETHQIELKRLEASTSERLQSLKASQDEQKAEKDARRDYEYEARKRLYEECEPLLFQLIELSENALHRIYSIARTAKAGELSSREGWLSDTRAYYTVSTVYKLMAPLVIYRLIQRRLTLVDLNVDPHINAQYSLAKRVYISFTDDFELARINPELDYDPNAEPSAQVMRRQPDKYVRQAIFVGWLDSLIDDFIKREADGSLRCMTYGEFEKAYFQEDAQIEPFNIAVSLFLNFHPRTRPVLWRILVSQAHIYEGLIRTREMKFSYAEGNARPLLTSVPESEKWRFDWRHSEDTATDEEVLVIPFEVARSYLRKHLEQLWSEG